MSRFDEFRESLHKVKAYLEEAIDCLEDDDDDDFDSEADRYLEANSALSEAWAILSEAKGDVSDNVGVQCDSIKLNIVIDEVWGLKRKVWNDAKNSYGDEEYDYHKCRGYIRSIRGLWSDIDQIFKDAR